MRYFLYSLLVCATCSAQLPVIPVALQSGSGTWYPTNAGQTAVFWFDSVPSAFISARTGSSGSGTVPANSGAAVSITNWVGSFGATSGNNPLYFTSGGGNSGTTPRISFNNGASARYILDIGKLTNFTVIMVATLSSAATANQGLFSNGNGTPYLELNANKLTMSAGTPVSGAATIGTGSYIITWIQKSGGTSEIYTNGVLYVSGNDGTDGYNSASPIIAQARVNHFTGDFSRLWCWTNTLSGGDISSAITQTKTDFGFP